ncbi:MAG: c-type cytochrome domain-containing protein, partial [Maioricimonas sp. JB049]
MTRAFSHTLSTVCCMMLVAVSAASAADSTEPSPEQFRFFEQDVRPLLVEHCSKCHGAEKQSGGLRVDSVGALLGGGDSGPAIIAGNPEESLLIEAINWESYEMPPSSKLDGKAIEVLTRWVKMGAPWPGGDREAMVRPGGPKITEEDRAFWSFRPLSVPESPAAAAAWGQNDIDAFILRKLEEQNLTPAPRADRVTLVRRLYQAVTGLPPTPEQVDAFVHDESPEAYAN